MPPLRFLLLACLATGLTCLIATHAAEPLATDDSVYLDHFTGAFTHRTVNTMTITREGRELRADAGDGRPPARLLPQKQRGEFLMRNADLVFRFIEDDVGNVTALDIIDSRGTTRRLQRQGDPQAATTALRAVAVDATTSVHARVFNGYARHRGSDGTYPVETYAFAEGGFQRSSPVADSSVDGMTFESLARLIAPAMKAQGYEPSTEADATDLVVMIYWGATTADEHPAVIAEETNDPLSHKIRGELNRKNARLLGFEEAIEALPVVPGSNAAVRRAMLFDDLEESRYWVALVALDYQAAQRDEGVRPLWSVRYNIRSRGTTFDAALPQMTDFASRYFGRDSDGLINPATRMPTTEVGIGELEVVE